MKTHSLQNMSTFENDTLNTKACCENALDTINRQVHKTTWKKQIAKIRHNWRTRSRLARLDDAQMKDLGLTSADIDNELNKPLWK